MLTSKELNSLSDGGFLMMLFALISVLTVPGETINKNCEYNSDAVSLRAMRAAVPEGSCI